VSMRSQWMMDKDGYIFVYSLLDKSSLRQLFNFVDLLSQGNHMHYYAHRPTDACQFFIYRYLSMLY
jgi:hypothetical protein